MKSRRKKKDVGLSGTDSSCQPQAKTSPALLSLNLSLQPGQLCQESQKGSKLPFGSHFSLWVGKNQAVEWSLWERKELNSSFMLPTLSTLSQRRRDTIEWLSRRTSYSLATEICRLLRRSPVPLCLGAEAGWQSWVTCRAWSYQAELVSHLPADLRTFLRVFVEFSLCHTFLTLSVIVVCSTLGLGPLPL